MQSGGVNFLVHFCILCYHQQNPFLSHINRLFETTLIKPISYVIRILCESSWLCIKNKLKIDVKCNLGYQVFFSSCALSNLDRIVVRFNILIERKMEKKTFANFVCENMFQFADFSIRRAVCENNLCTNLKLKRKLILNRRIYFIVIFDLQTLLRLNNMKLLGCVAVTKITTVS